MKVDLYIRELYPVYVVDGYFPNFENQNLIDIDENTLKRWSKVCDEFLKVQKEMFCEYEKDKKLKPNLENHFDLDIFCVPELDDDTDDTEDELEK